MTPEPFTDSDSGFSEAFGDSSRYPPKSHLHAPHYFDRPGLLWILACVLFAAAAARWLPYMVEPNGMRTALVSMGWADASPAHTASLPQDTGASRAALQAPAREALTAAVFRQY